AVGALAAMKRKSSLQPPKPNVYLSQSEVFFDCTIPWDSEACNKDDSAIYSPKWKVRLRRMRTPVAGAALGGAALSLLTTGAASIGRQVLGVSGSAHGSTRIVRV